jgi:hypothetical protein
MRRRMFAMDASANIKGLVEEYASILEIAVKVSAGDVGYDPVNVEKLLVKELEWTPRAAEHLLKLSNDYGSFMLRNALALSLALKIEDGDLEF